VCRRVGQTGRSTTADVPLPGARETSAGAPGASDAPAFLRGLYGTRAAQVLALAQSAPGLDRPLSPAYPDIGAQVLFAVRLEHCVRLSDFIRRRTLLGAATDQGWDAAPRVADLMAAELAWSPTQVSAELDTYRRDIASTRAFTEDS